MIFEDAYRLERFFKDRIDEARGFALLLQSNDWYRIIRAVA